MMFQDDREEGRDWGHEVTVIPDLDEEGGESLLGSPGGGENWTFGVTQWHKQHNKWYSWWTGNELFFIRFGIHGNNANPKLNLHENLEVDDSVVAQWDDDGNDFYNKNVDHDAFDDGEEFHLHCIGIAAAAQYGDNWIVPWNSSAWDVEGILGDPNSSTAGILTEKERTSNPNEIRARIARPVWWRIGEPGEEDEYYIMLFHCDTYHSQTPPVSPATWDDETWSPGGSFNLDEGSHEGAQLFYIVTSNAPILDPWAPNEGEGVEITFPYNPSQNQYHWFRWILMKKDPNGDQQVYKGTPFKFYITNP